MDHNLDERVPDPPEPDEDRVRSRAEQIEAEQPVEPEDAEVEAHAILSESEARIEDPTARDLEEDRVERRSSGDTS